MHERPRATRRQVAVTDAMVQATLGGLAMILEYAGFDLSRPYRGEDHGIGHIYTQDFVDVVTRRKEE